MFKSIRDRSVIITGASKGIGRGIAQAFVGQGAKVLLVARNAADLDRTASELGAASANVATLAADVANEADMQRMAELARERHGGIDILCCNAGVYPELRLEQMRPADWDLVMHTNLRGTFLPIRAALPGLKASAGGRIVVISSISGMITGLPGFAHYSASKAGQVGLVRTAALELAPHRITVNAVLPGNIRTEGLEALGSEYLTTMASAVPLQRLGMPEDVAHAVLFLASEEAAFITGQTLVVDGGQVLPESRSAAD